MGLINLFHFGNIVVDFLQQSTQHHKRFDLCSPFAAAIVAVPKREVRGRGKYFGLVPQDV